jgi:hypothetical protein
MGESVCQCGACCVAGRQALVGLREGNEGAGMIGMKKEHEKWMVMKLRGDAVNAMVHMSSHDCPALTNST